MKIDNISIDEQHFRDFTKDEFVNMFKGILKTCINEAWSKLQKELGRQNLVIAIEEHLEQQENGNTSTDGTAVSQPKNKRVGRKGAGKARD